MASKATASARAIAAALLNWPGVVSESLGRFWNPRTMQPAFNPRQTEIKITNRMGDSFEFTSCVQNRARDTHSDDLGKNVKHCIPYGVNNSSVIESDPFQPNVPPSSISAVVNVIVEPPESTQ